MDTEVIEVTVFLNVETPFVSVLSVVELCRGCTEVFIRIKIYGVADGIHCGARYA